MSDSENDIKPESKTTVEGKYVTKARYDPVPIPRHISVEIKDKEDIKIGEEENQPGGNENEDETNEVENEENEEPEDQKESEKPLLDEDTVTLDISKLGKDDDTATLPITDKKKTSISDIEAQEKKQKENLPIYLFPCSRIKDAWRDSTNLFSFIFAAVCIIFQTVGWFTCVGGVPFMSLVMLIIGSIYINDCTIEPKIPIYLIVSGVVGIIQHVLTIWTTYVPRGSQGRLKVYRSYCSSLNGALHLFLMIWFILGCVWVYGAHSSVEYEERDREKDEYCHKTLYLFAFWILNLSFILLGMIVMLSICFIVCVVASPKDEEKGVVQ